MARELVQTHAAALDGKKDLFREEKPSVGKCPRCGSPVHEGKKNYYCSNKECAFVMWKNDRFFEERKTAFSAKIACWEVSQTLFCGGLHPLKIFKNIWQKCGRTRSRPCSQKMQLMTLPQRKEVFHYGKFTGHRKGLSRRA